MQTFVQKYLNEMIILIEKLVNIDSGSLYKPGIDQVGTILKEHFSDMEFTYREIVEKEQGNHLIIQHKDAQKPEVIILAHMDTVFPVGTVKSRPFRIDGERAYGPGVIDMKSSLVTLLFALKALIEHEEVSYKNVQIFLNSDEEIGSVTSRKWIEQLAKGKKYALVMEPARKDGSLVSSRKGKGNYVLNIEGKAAHSGIEPEKGRSAIEELAHKVIQLHELSDPENGISVNVGLIEGGSSANTVSAHASAHVDVRITDIEQAETVEKRIEEICSTTEIPGTTISLEGEMNRPPMEKNKGTRSLLKIIEEVGESIGVAVEDTATGGGSDASFTAALGIPTIDGLGPVGGNPHSEKEYLEIPSLVERTHLLAAVIKRLSEE